MDIRKSFKGQFLKAGDFDGPQVLTMRKVYNERIGQDKTEKPVLYFQDLDQGLVLNATNGKTIAELYGWETREWDGKTIEVYPTQTDFGGKTVDCLRVRAPEVDETQDIGFHNDPIPFGDSAA
jgi:hypothetical protein